MEEPGRSTDLAGGSAQMLQRRRNAFAVQVAQLHGERHFTGNDVGRVRTHVQSSHGGHPHPPLQGRGLDRGDEARGGNQRVAAQLHDRGAGMVGSPDDLHVGVGDSGDTLDQTDGQSERFQDRALFDVQLEKRGKFAGVTRGGADAVRLSADGVNGLGQGAPGVVGAGKIAIVELSNHCATAAG